MNVYNNNLNSGFSISPQGSLMEQEESEPDSSLSQSPSVLDWLSQARSTRSQQHQDTMQRHRVQTFN